MGYFSGQPGGERRESVASVLFSRQKANSSLRGGCGHNTKTGCPMLSPPYFSIVPYFAPGSFAHSGQEHVWWPITRVILSERAGRGLEAVQLDSFVSLEG